MKKKKKETYKKKKRRQEYTELYKKDLNEPDNPNGVPLT